MGATRRNPSQADIIAVMVGQALGVAQANVQSAVATKQGSEAVAEARGKRDALRELKDRIDRYIGGDITALYP